MILGFYYHSNIKVLKEKLIVPGYIGVFIDELAKNVEKLYLFLEEQTDENSKLEDYELQQKNIVFISLGKKSTFYNRLLFPKAKLLAFTKYISEIDYLLLRVPTPLAPRIFFKLRKTNKLKLLVVGDYVKGLKALEQPIYRKVPIILITYFYQILHNKMIGQVDTMVNSAELYEKYKNLAKSIKQVRTTTLSKNSFYERIDTCENHKIKILYTGRINFQKGLRELIEASSEIKRHNIEINIVGWEEPGSFSYTKSLKELALKCNIEDRVIFHGKKSIGDELFKYYREADIYVIASYHEGFPRTIWEAMSNGLPVIASKVGSIPYFLENHKDALLIEPKSKQEIYNALLELIENRSLRRGMIQNGYKLAYENTLEIQTKALINNILNK